MKKIENLKTIEFSEKKIMIWIKFQLFWKIIQDLLNQYYLQN